MYSRLRRLRTERGWSQAALGEKLGVSEANDQRHRRRQIRSQPAAGLCHCRAVQTVYRKDIRSGQNRIGGGPHAKHIGMKVASGSWLGHSGSTREARRAGERQSAGVAAVTSRRCATNAPSNSGTTYKRGASTALQTIPDARSHGHAARSSTSAIQKGETTQPTSHSVSRGAIALPLLDAQRARTPPVIRFAANTMKPRRSQKPGSCTRYQGYEGKPLAMDRSTRAPA